MKPLEPEYRAELLAAAAALAASAPLPTAGQAFRLAPLLTWSQMPRAA